MMEFFCGTVYATAILRAVGARNMFSRLQNAMDKTSKTRVALDKGVHQALDDFRWLADDITGRPTRIAELVPLVPLAEGHHDAAGSAGTGAGGVWFPSDTLQPREGWKAGVPVVWRYQWPECITSRLVSLSLIHI